MNMIIFRVECSKNPQAYNTGTWRLLYWNPYKVICRPIDNTQDLYTAAGMRAFSKLEKPQLSWKIILPGQFGNSDTNQFHSQASIGVNFFKTYPKFTVNFSTHQIWWVGLVSLNQLNHVTWVCHNTWSHRNFTLHRRNFLECVHPLHLTLFFLE